MKFRSSIGLQTNAKGDKMSIEHTDFKKLLNELGRYKDFDQYEMETERYRIERRGGQFVVVWTSCYSLTDREYAVDRATMLTRIENIRAAGKSTAQHERALFDLDRAQEDYANEMDRLLSGVDLKSLRLF